VSRPGHGRGGGGGLVFCRRRGFVAGRPLSRLQGRRSSLLVVLEGLSVEDWYTLEKRELT